MRVPLMLSFQRLFAAVAGLTPLVPTTALAQANQAAAAGFAGWRLSQDTVMVTVLAGGIGMMCLAGAVVIFYMWLRRTEHGHDRRRPLPTTGAALVAQAAPKNRVLAVGVAIFSLAMFVSAFLIGVVDHIEKRAREPAHLTATHAAQAVR
jgi:hypothetical protein